MSHALAGLTLKHLWRKTMDRAEQAWVDYEYREHPKGLYHTCFVDGYKEGYEQAEKDFIERLAKFYPTLDYTFRSYLLQDFPELESKIKNCE